MAKLNPLVLLLIVLVVAFFLLMLSSSYDYQPYDALEEKYMRYESMTNNENPEEEEYPPTDVPTDISAMYVQENEEEPESFSLYSNIVNKENFEPIVNVAQTIQYGPLRDSEIIDKFSQVTKNGVDGVDGCVSSGLSNSGGYICLTPELIKLLKTRGGNASGAEMNV